MPKAQAYNITMYIMAGLFVIGFICNLFIKAVDKRYHMTPDGETALATAAAAGREVAPRAGKSASARGGSAMTSENQNGTPAWQLVLAWGFVGIPLAWGVAQTIANAMKLFQ